MLRLFILSIVTLLLTQCNERDSRATSKDCISLNDSATGYSNMFNTSHDTATLILAINYGEQAIQCDTNFTQAYSNLLFLHLQKRDSAKAMWCVNKLLTLTNYSYNTYFLKAETLNSLGYEDSAASIYTLVYNKLFYELSVADTLDFEKMQIYSLCDMYLNGKEHAMNSVDSCAHVYKINNDDPWVLALKEIILSYNNRSDSTNSEFRRDSVTLSLTKPKN